MFNSHFLDIFVLISDGEENTTWKLRVLQNMTGKKHGTVRLETAGTRCGEILFAGFSLSNEVNVAYIIEKRSQTELGKHIDGSAVTFRSFPRQRLSEM